MKATGSCIYPKSRRLPLSLCYVVGCILIVISPPEAPESWLLN